MAYQEREFDDSGGRGKRPAGARQVHSAGLHSGAAVRLAVPHDFQKAVSGSAGAADGRCDDRFKDVCEHAHDRPPQPDDMWGDWGLRATDG